MLRQHRRLGTPPPLTEPALELDWLQYWFMFPVGIFVATAAMLSGIGGAAMFIPIFVLGFPLLGPEYPLSTSAAIGTAVLTQVFGFMSGFAGYYRKRLIDFRSAVPYACIAVPVAAAGATLFGGLQSHETLLKGAYAVLMLAPCAIVLRRTHPSAPSGPQPASLREDDQTEIRTVTDRSGNAYRFARPRPRAFGASVTGIGAFLTGFLGVGIGEVVLPLLVKRHRVPIAVAAATSVFIVILTVLTASFMQVGLLIKAGGFGAVPWNLVCYTIPGVIIGGQIGPLLQGRIDQRTIERAIAFLFAAIGGAMAVIALKGFL